MIFLGYVLIILLILLIFYNFINLIIRPIVGFRSPSEENTVGKLVLFGFEPLTSRLAGERLTARLPAKKTTKITKQKTIMNAVA